MASRPTVWVHNARVTTVSERVAIPGSSSLARGMLLAITLIAVELLWARYASDAANQIADHMTWWTHHLRLFAWTFLSVQFLLLAVVVGLGARSAGRRVVAVGLCGAGAAVTIGSYELVNYLFTHPTFRQTSPDPGVVRILGYATVMLVTSVAALAWCVSRRRGFSWLLPALLVASASAALVHGWDNPSRWQGLDSRWTVVVDTGITQIVPVVLACLVAWAIDVKANRPAP